MINICFWDIEFENTFEPSFDTVLSTILSQNYLNILLEFHYTTNISSPPKKSILP